MDTTDTTTDLVIIDAELVDDTDSDGNSIANTLATSAATSAVIVVGVLAYKFLKPKVVALVHRHKNDEEPPLVVESTIVETPKKTEKV